MAPDITGLCRDQLDFGSHWFSPVPPNKMSISGLVLRFSVFPWLNELALMMTSESSPMPLPGLLSSELVVSWLY